MERVGVGDPIRMDDFVGMAVVRGLRGKVDSERVMLIEAETIPENHMQEITEYKPTHILIIDAAKQGMKAGEARLMNPSLLADFPAFSTHMLPTRIFCNYLASEAKAKIALLLIEPSMTDSGDRLTVQVEARSSGIGHYISEILS